MALGRSVLPLVLLAAVAATGEAQSARVPPLIEILARASAYVQQFENDFASVIADEQYDQSLTVLNPGQVMRRRDIAHRRILSEMLFIWLPAEQLWLMTRNARSVDGRPVADSERRLARAMEQSGGERLGQLGEIRELSASYNVGEIRRNFSDPTFALQFLSNRLRTRFRWTLRGAGRIAGTAAWKIDFEERVHPTLVKRDEVDLISTGTVWVHQVDGAILKTWLEVDDSMLWTQAGMDVEYRYESKLNLWAPARMSERYKQVRVMVPFPVGWASAERDERITCEASYSNYRHFETAGRLVTPQ